METKTNQDTSTIAAFIADATPARVVERYEGLARAAQTADFGVLDEDVVIIDTETTGVSFNHDRLTQIAAARMQRGKITEWFVTFVNPGKPIPEEVAHLTNIHDEDVADAPTPAEALSQLVEFVGSSDLVAHNANFDYTFCTQLPEGAPLKENIWIDSLDLTRIALPRLTSHRLLDLVHAFDAPISTHRADADVEALSVIYRVLLAAVAAMPPTLVKTIAEMGTIEQWPTIKVFKELAPQSDERFDVRQNRRDLVLSLQRKPRMDAEVIARDPHAQLKFATDEEIDQAFTADGLVGGLYKNFEAREEQKIMAQQVNRAFCDGKNLAVEAGTGVGKSMAYLVPAVLAARKNNIGIGVATKTNALLDQLMHKELPLLAQRCEGLTYASLKGFSHYPCLMRIERLMNEGPKTRTQGSQELFQGAGLAGMLSFVEQTDFDDMDSLKIDYRALPRYLTTTTSHDCLRRKCPFYGTRCFVHGARAMAESADILVTNHTLLFCDVAADGGLLPPVRYWVVDEAHGAENEARRAFSRSLDADEIMRLASRVGTSDARRNIFLRAERRAVGQADVSVDEAKQALGAAEFDREQEKGHSAGDTLLFALSGKAKRAGIAFEQAADEFCRHIHDLMFFEPGSRSKNYDRVELWLNDEIRAGDTFGQLVSLGRVLYDATDKLIKASQDMVGLLENVEGAAAAQRDIAAAAMDLRDILSAIEVILLDAPPTYAYSAHLTRKNNGGESLEALLVNVGDMLNNTLFANTHSVVFTSATITIADDFKAFTSALGLGSTEESPLVTCKLDSSYDFDGHMTVYVASDMPEPNDPRYMDALNRLLVGIHLAQGGSTLTLFTNRREMEKSFDVVRPLIQEQALRLVCQKWNVSAKNLRDEFLKDESLSLFALKSFWEGFDAPGETLKTVIIPKLPFGKPTDPLSCERARLDSQAWSHFVLPAAVLETKQAAGRLIRSSTDTGNLVMADKRLVSKGYGKVFLRSLPSKTVKTMTCEAIVEELAEKMKI